MGKVRKIGSGLYPDFAFHTCSTQWEVPFTDTSTTATNPPRYLGERWCGRLQQTAAGSMVLILLRRSRDHLYSTLTPSSALITTNPSMVSSMCVTPLFTWRYLFSFGVIFISCVSRVRSVIYSHCLKCQAEDTFND